MLGNKHKRNVLYLNTRKYKLKKFEKSNNDKLSQEDLKLQAGKHIEQVINNIKEINDKSKQRQNYNPKKLITEKVKYQEAKNIYNQTLLKQQHMAAVVNKINEINNKREQQEENILKEKLNMLAEGATERDLKDKNKDLPQSLDNSFSSEASTTDELNEDNKIFHFSDSRDMNKLLNNLNVPIWREKRDKSKGFEQSNKPIRNNKPVKLFLGYGLTNDIAIKSEDNSKSSFLKKILRESDQATKNGQTTSKQELPSHIAARTLLGFKNFKHPPFKPATAKRHSEYVSEQPATEYEQVIPKPELSRPIAAIKLPKIEKKLPEIINTKPVKLILSSGRSSHQANYRK